MRSWKVAFAAIAVAVIVIAFLVLRRGDALIGGTAGAATPNPATIAMPVPVTKIVKKAVPIYLDYSARTESIRNIALQAKVSGYIRQQHVPDGTDVAAVMSGLRLGVLGWSDGRVRLHSGLRRAVPKRV